MAWTSTSVFFAFLFAFAALTDMASFAFEALMYSRPEKFPVKKYLKPSLYVSIVSKIIFILCLGFGFGMQVVVDEKVPVVTTGAGNPGEYIPALKAIGSKVIPVVASVALAKRLVRTGVDAVIAEGTESGGHIGDITTMAAVSFLFRSVLS